MREAGCETCYRQRVDELPETVRAAIAEAEAAGMTVTRSGMSQNDPRHRPTFTGVVSWFSASGITIDKNGGVVGWADEANPRLVASGPLGPHCVALALAGFRETSEGVWMLAL